MIKTQNSATASECDEARFHAYGDTHSDRNHCRAGKPDASEAWATTATR